MIKSFKLSENETVIYQQQGPELGQFLWQLREMVFNRLSDDSMMFDFKIGETNYKLFPPSDEKEKQEQKALRKQIAIEIIQRDVAESLAHMSCGYEDCDHESFRLSNSLGVFSEQSPRGWIVPYEKEEPSKEAHCHYCGRYWLYKGDECPQLCTRCTEQGKTIETFTEDDLCKRCHESKAHRSPLFKGNRPN